MKYALLSVDSQVDFCEGGSLAVAGANAAMQRAAKMIDRIGDSLDEILATADQHHKMHIANPGYWVNSQGTHPTPFTQIRYDEVKLGKWRPIMPSKLQWGKDYTQQLEAKNRVLTIWPEHCLILSPGACFHPAILQSFLQWEEKNSGYVVKVPKGSNLDTEHYGAVEAEVPTGDSSTQTNSLIIDTLSDYDKIGFFGLATDYCVATTIKQIVDKFGPNSAKKFVLIEDCVAGIDAKASQDFINQMHAQGMEISTSESFLA